VRNGALMKPISLILLPSAVMSLILATATCADTNDGSLVGGAGPEGGFGAGTTTEPPNDAEPLPDGSEPDGGGVPPTQLEPCDVAACWDAPGFTSACGSFSIDENFHTGLYSVHEYAVRAPEGVMIELRFTRQAGTWDPALIVQDAAGTTISDGEHVASTADFTVELVSSGRGLDTATVRITSAQEQQLAVFVTSWEVVDGAFGPAMPTDAEYRLTDAADCEPQGGLLSPPNFDPNDVVNGYYLLPDSDPAGLYTHRGEDCSRGTKLLIDVLYTVAYRWHEIHPDYSPIEYGDLNYSSSCSTANHETHQDGTHADVMVACATHASCATPQLSIDLANLFVETLGSCGIIFNDVPVQDAVNPYFYQLCAYAPWNGEYMRSYTGHEDHFHIRVKKPDGLCN
jgi:hypothetical protein